ncbi:PorT family protein [Anaerorudis cellulosivorans]|uniref:PorT family protein n=1 Tax=Anaerorudis cellulosivorans TaxID=3397862 RepID=UPI00221E6A2D|nr:PorT family protein [Seramator thermalis]MCW1735765.1 PorT family protein [Seramator thermalis]
MMSEKDNIKEQFRHKLNDYEAPVLDNEWDRLEESLDKAMRQRAVQRQWMAAAAVIVALIVGGLIYLNFPVDGDKAIVTKKVAPSDKNESLFPIVEENEMKQSPLVVSADENKFKEFEKTETGIKTELPVETETQYPQTVELPVVDADKSDEKDYPEEQSGELTDEEMDRFIEEFVNQRNNNQTHLSFAEEGESEPIAIALNARGGLTSLHRTTNSPMTLKSVATKNYAVNDSPEKSLMTGNMNHMEFNADQVDVTENIAEMVHEQPISIGLTFSKLIMDRLSVETGLMYTYLYSKAKNTANQFKSQETQQLHYLGIPLNVNYTLLSFHKLNVYVSMGGMIEKDVYGKYQYVDETVEPETNGTSGKKVSVNIHQHNPQVSVNAGMGLSYPLFNNLGIYGKIGGAYYFDANNKYKTFYSDKKIVLDLNVGLKLNF